MSRVVRIHRHGGPEELKVEDEVVGAPGAMVQDILPFQVPTESVRRWCFSPT